MKNNFKNMKASILFLILLSVLILGCSQKGSDSENNKISKAITEKVELIPSGKDVENAIELPPFSDGIYPCNDCHSDQKPNPTKRELVDMHDDISAMFDHD